LKLRRKPLRKYTANRMTLSFERLIETNTSELNGRAVLVAFSGGKDSCSLLHWLSVNRERLSIRLAACHVNHMIRGENAERDALLCENFCRQYKIPFYLEKRNVPEFASKEGKGLEQAARTLRYDSLGLIAEKEGFELILTAHTKDDMAETFFIRVFQGASLYTLGGVKKRFGKIFRPMLDISTADVLEYINQYAIPTTFDETNDDTTYLRNWVRKDIMSAIKGYNPAFLDKINELMEQSVQLDSYMSKRLKDIFIYKDEVYRSDKLQSLEPEEQAWAIRNLLTSLFRAEKRHIEEVLRIIKDKQSTRIDLPMGYHAECSFGVLRIFNAELLKEINLIKPAGASEVKLKNKKLKFTGHLVQAELSIRTRKNGDRIGKKKLKDLFIDSKTELFDRDTALIVEEDHKIIWVETIYPNSDIFCDS
jgi:tRNA(Ile)-lysidine synthase